jgi:hypothetical protein
MAILLKEGLIDGSKPGKLLIGKDEIDAVIWESILDLCDYKPVFDEDVPEYLEDETTYNMANIIRLFSREKEYVYPVMAKIEYKDLPSLGNLPFECQILLDPKNVRPLKDGSKPPKGVYKISAVIYGILRVPGAAKEDLAIVFLYLPTCEENG